MSAPLRLQLTHPTAPLSGVWMLPRSKSLWAREILLDASEGHLLSQEALPADSPQDIRSLLSALHDYYSGSSVINVGESGTAMRLLLAWLVAYADHAIELTGTARQTQRPISAEVTALRQLGAEIYYLDQEGYPPLSLRPSQLTGQVVQIDASASSQYLSALLLLAPRLPVGTIIDTRPHSIASRPYADMTRTLLCSRGYHWHEQEQGLFRLERSSIERESYTPGERDWSAASYVYALMSLAPVDSEVHLPDLCYPSLQGDAAHLVELFEPLGVVTEVTTMGIRLRRRESDDSQQPVIRSMSACPDLVPALVAALIGLGRPFQLRDIGHLRLKESDRLEALTAEFAKLGITLTSTGDDLSWLGSEVPHSSANAPQRIDPHQDHRIAMALAVLSLRVEALEIASPEVVSKSYPDYWRQLLTFVPS